MPRTLLALLLFALQSFLILQGATFIDKLIVPFLITATSGLIIWWYFASLLTAPWQQHQPTGSCIPGVVIAVVSVAALIPILNDIILAVPRPGSGSDVIPQIEALYKRFRHGEQPYYPVRDFSWQPFPVYMPFHWLPLGITSPLHLDSRWAGVIVMGILSGIWGYYAWQPAAKVRSAVMCLLPAAVIYSFAAWSWYDMAVTHEIIIAAYYLLLAAALLSGSTFWIACGIIACLLSRYTFVFWLPLYAVLLWLRLPRRTSYIVWGSAAAAIIVFYVIPFLLRDPSILREGIKYHNQCYVAEWNGYGEPPVVKAFDKGLNFSFYVYNNTTGNMEHRVAVARAIQAAAMLLSLAAGFLLYRRWRHRIPFAQFCLGMLYWMLMAFYLFSPHTYRYYYVPTQVIAAVLISSIIRPVRRLAKQEHIAQVN